MINMLQTSDKQKEVSRVFGHVTESKHSISQSHLVSVQMMTDSERVDGERLPGWWTEIPLDQEFSSFLEQF